MRTRILVTLLITFAVMTIMLAGAFALAKAAPAATGATFRVSVASDGTQGNDDSWDPSISADGRYVAFGSEADNLVAGDSNGFLDVFVHDRMTGATTRVSVASNGTQGNNWSNIASISADGRYVAFTSNANNLVPNDTNGTWDVFVHDRDTATTTRVSVASDGTQSNALSGYAVSISGDGLLVAFDSLASNLVLTDTNNTWDVFVHDLTTGDTTRVSVAGDGSEGDADSRFPDISSDGLFVAFDSSAGNLVTGDANGNRDVFVHDLTTGDTTRVSVATGGAQGDDDSTRASISGDGSLVAFQSLASTLVLSDTNGVSDIFVRDVAAGTTTRVSVASDGTEANDDSHFADIASGGNHVAFESSADNLVPVDSNLFSDIFVHDRTISETMRVSVASDGAQSNGGASRARISGDGGNVAFASGATNLVPGDTNGGSDIFVHDQTGAYAVAPVVTISTSDSITATLDWAGHPANCSYDVLRSAAPFGGYSPLVTGLVTTTYDDANALGDPDNNLFYRVRAVNCDETTTADSNRTGGFSFTLVPGS